MRGRGADLWLQALVPLGDQVLDVGIKLVVCVNVYVLLQECHDVGPQLLQLLLRLTQLSLRGAQALLRSLGPQVGAALVGMAQVLQPDFILLEVLFLLEEKPAGKCMGLQIPRALPDGHWCPQLARHQEAWSEWVSNPGASVSAAPERKDLEAHLTGRPQGWRWDHTKEALGLKSSANRKP